MISWMEDTRECIFSERVLHCGRDDQEPMAAEMEMDVQIDRKLEELEELDAAGRNLLNAEHHLVNMIHERLEELRSMLAWMLVHWRDQKHQRSQRRNNETEPNEDLIDSEPPIEQTPGDNIYSETTVDSTRDNYSETTVESTRDNIYSETTVESTRDNIYSETTVESTRDNIYSETTVKSTRDNIYSETTVESTRDNIYSETTVESTRDNIYSETTVESTRDNIYSETTVESKDNIYSETVKSTRDNIYSETTVESTRDNIYSETTVESTRDNSYSETTVESTRDNIYSETTVESTRDNSYSETTVKSTRDNIYSETTVKSTRDNIYSETTGADINTDDIACSTHSTPAQPETHSTPAQPETHFTPALSVFEDRLRKIDSLYCPATDQQSWKDQEDGYQVMNSNTGPLRGLTSPPETHQSSCLVLKEPSSPALCLGGTMSLGGTSFNSSPKVGLGGQGVSLVSQGVCLGNQGGMVYRGGTVKNSPTLSLGGSVDLGGTVNLILSLGNQGDSHVEVMEANPRVGEEESTEPVHRPPKTFWRCCQGLWENTLCSLKRKIYRQSAEQDNNMTSAPTYESILLPRLHTKTSSSSSPSSLPKNTSIFSSLKIRSKKRRRKRDAGRHTIQKIMVVEGEEQTEVACPAEAAPQQITLYDTQTWPMKEGRRKKKSLLKAEGVGPGQGVELVDYMDNPLARDIEDECSGVSTVSPYAVTEAVSIAPPRGQVRSHCRFLSLGSVLTFDLSKDMRLIPSIQDVITIGLPEHRGTPNPNLNPNPHTETHAALSSFKRTRSPPSDTHRAPDNEAVTTYRHETMTQIQTQPLLTLTLTQPLLTQTQPLPTQTQPLLTQIQTQPLLTLTLTQPLLTLTQPLLTQTQPLPTQTQPLLTQTQPLLTQAQPQTPTQILKQTKPLTQAVQLEPLSNLDTDFPPPPPPALDEDWDENVSSNDISLSQIQTVLQEPEQEWSDLIFSKQPPITAYCPKSPTPMNRDHYNYMETTMVSRSPIVKSKDPCPSSAYQNHESKDPCPSSAYQNHESKDPCPSSAYKNYESKDPCPSSAYQNHERKDPCPSSAYQNHESKDPCPSSAYQNHESKDPCPSSAYQNHERNDPCPSSAYKNYESKDPCPSSAYQNHERNDPCPSSAYKNYESKDPVHPQPIRTMRARTLSLLSL
ncbi:uncharacterized protein LOC118380944 [Oncorhynchus keta]|uniref:uncharacterized protein LOC118380944 n=1 Tax=Oncorhynchus keta TaxID=8018 RepID=UPI00227BF3B8|nr:uncharacterized protein LOC118380944 [Oncorhynchus keta]